MKSLAAALLLLCGFAACSRAPDAPSGGGAGAAPEPAFDSLPVEMTVQQRTTAPVTGTREELRLTIDDITHGQVMVSLATKDGAPVMAPVSMQPGSSAPFTHRGASLVVTCKRIENRLIGQDWGTFVFASVPGESQKIERLLAVIAGTKGATFVRNGMEHGAQEAADHIRSKWKAKAGEIATASQFIDVIASRSDLSGEAYQIRFEGGRVVELGSWLRERLAAIERSRS